MVLSAIVPRFWVRHALARQIAAARPYRWASPLVPAARATPGPDVIVVGAGVGGLTAAGLLAREGVRVAVCEQYTMPGGFVHSWRRVLTLDGKRATFRFDGGMHDVSGLYPGGAVRAVLERLELFSPADWARLDHRFVRDGRAFDMPREWNHYVAALAALQPDAAPRVREVMDVIRAVFEGMYATGANHGGIPGPLDSAESMLAFAREHRASARGALDAAALRPADCARSARTGAHAAARPFGLRDGPSRCAGRSRRGAPLRLLSPGRPLPDRRLGRDLATHRAPDRRGRRHGAARHAGRARHRGGRCG
jgi:hypothetical protein